MIRATSRTVRQRVSKSSAVVPELCRTIGTQSVSLAQDGKDASLTGDHAQKAANQDLSDAPVNATISRVHHGPGKEKKTMAELDEELRLKLEGRSGDGGNAGVEYEDGKAEGLKRNVKANMFRII